MALRNDSSTTIIQEGRTARLVASFLEMGGLRPPIPPFVPRDTSVLLFES